jgi:hypothetical protein
MAWVNTGFRRTLKLQIIKTEANPSLSGFPSTGITYTIDGNTNQFTGTTLTPYTWANGLTMGKAPLAEFEARRQLTEIWVEEHFPEEAYSGITWGNTRVGAGMYIDVIAVGGGIAFGLYTNAGKTTPMVTTETICMPCNYVYKDGLDPEVSGTDYFYINKNTSGSTCNIDTDISNYSILRFKSVDIINISEAPPQCSTNTMSYTEIEKQNTFTIDESNLGGFQQI